MSPATLYILVTVNLVALNIVSPLSCTTASPFQNPRSRTEVIVNLHKTPLVYNHPCSHLDL